MSHIENKVIMVDLTLARSEAEVQIEDPNEVEQERIINENTKRDDRKASGGRN